MTRVTLAEATTDEAIDQELDAMVARAVAMMDRSPWWTLDVLELVWLVRRLRRERKSSR